MRAACTLLAVLCLPMLLGGCPREGPRFQGVSGYWYASYPDGPELVIHYDKSSDTYSWEVQPSRRTSGDPLASGSVTPKKDGSWVFHDNATGTEDTVRPDYLEDAGPGELVLRGVKYERVLK